MATPEAPRGLIIDLITPLKKDGKIDERGLVRLLERVLPCAQGLFLCGPHMGRGRGLDATKRGDLLECTLSQVQGRVPVMVWVTQDTTEETRETFESLRERVRAHRKESGVFWVDTPLYHHSNRGLAQYCADIAGGSGEPFILHNDPDLVEGLARPLKRSNIRTGILKELGGMTAIRGLIFQGSLDRARHYQKATRARGGFRIYDGDEDQFLTHPSLSGVVSGTANLAPRAWQRITASSLNLQPRHKSYPDHQRQIWELGDCLRRLVDACRGTALPLVSKTLGDAGIIEDPRVPSRAVGLEAKSRALQELIQQLGDCSG